MTSTDSITKLRCIDCMDHNIISELSRDDGYDVCLDVDLMFNVYWV